MDPVEESRSIKSKSNTLSAWNKRVPRNEDWEVELKELSDIHCQGRERSTKESHTGNAAVEVTMGATRGTKGQPAYRSNKS